MLYTEIFDFNPLILARIQFAFTITFHIIFPSFTIGLAAWLVVVEGLWLKTKDDVYLSLYRMWVKIFAVAFGMGVVSGVVMSYQIGTNWSVFATKAGSVLGPLFGYEVMTAFFLEASFLGIMLFGWGKVSKRMHFIATVIVSVGTIISAFWILSANSWMHTPQGFIINEVGEIIPNNWLEIIFNPSFFYRFPHMLIAAFLTTSFVVGGVGGFYLLKKIHYQHARVMISMAVFMACLATPLQIFIGDMHGLNSLKYQPAKVAAMEGLWETEEGPDLVLFALPDEQNSTNKFAMTIPKLGGLILTHSLNGKVRGLNEWKKEDRPPVAIVFFAFRVMVGVGLLMLMMGTVGFFLFLKKRLYSTRWFHLCYVAFSPLGFIAIIAGWIVTEVGRQPYLIYNILRTGGANSPISGEYIAFSLMVFIITYLLVFGFGIYYIFKLIVKGPLTNSVEDKKDLYYSHSMENFVKK